MASMLEYGALCVRPAAAGVKLGVRRAFLIDLRATLPPIPARLLE